jgi:ADP-heptose:LPS heptosyltransferase
MTSDPAKILVLLSAGLGDLVIAAAALRALRRRFGSSRIVLAVSTKALAYASACPCADRAVAIDGALFSPGAARRLRLLLDLRAERFGLAVNLYEISTLAGMLKVRALFAALSPALTAGRDTDGRGSFYDLRSPDSRADGMGHGEHYARLLSLLGCEVRPEEKGALWMGGEARREAAEFLRRGGASPGEPLLGLQPGSQRASRLWLPERFAEAADALCAKTSARAVILGGPGEEPLAAGMASRMSSRPIVAAGALGFEASLALLPRLRLFLGTHSSLMHAANALGVPFVVLRGQSDMARDGPYLPAPGRFAVVEGRAPQGAAGPEDEPSPAMRSISVEEVVRAALGVLDHAG